MILHIAMMMMVKQEDGLNDDSNKTYYY